MHEWVTGPALEILLKTRGVQPGDRVQLKSRMDRLYSKEQDSVKDDALVVGVDQHLCVACPGMKNAEEGGIEYLYCDKDDIIAWRPGETC